MVGKGDVSRICRYCSEGEMLGTKVGSIWMGLWRNTDNYISGGSHLLWGPDQTQAAARASCCKGNMFASAPRASGSLLMNYIRVTSSWAVCWCPWLVCSGSSCSDLGVSGNSVVAASSRAQAAGERDEEASIWASFQREASQQGLLFWEAVALLSLSSCPGCHYPAPRSMAAFSHYLIQW